LNIFNFQYSSSTPRLDVSPRELLSLPPESEIGQIHARMHDNEPNYNSKDQQGIQAVEESLVVTQVIVDSDGVLHESIDGSNEDGGACIEHTQ
jgi:hypothetical protein